jgi:preprotein translocase SecE subunit
MALGIYKPGEGYWVRVMTAVMIAIATVATAVFVYNQSALLTESLPKSKYEFTGEASDKVVGNIAPGASVDILGPKDALTGAEPKLGTAIVDSFEPGRGATLKEIKLNNNAEPATASGGSLTGANNFRVTGLRVNGLPPISKEGLGGILVAVLLAGGAILAYWLAGIKVSTCEKLIATDYEMRKVNWSTPREVLGSTYVVIGACIFLAGGLYLVDQLFVWVFRSTGVLFS